MSQYLTCPYCHEPPQIIIGPTQAVCGTPGCKVLMWNPTTGYDPDDPERNVAQYVDLSPLEGVAPEDIELVFTDDEEPQ